MKSYNVAQKVTAGVFFLTVFIYLILNIRTQRYDIGYGLSMVAPPGSVLEYSETVRGAENAINYYSYRREEMVNIYSRIQMLLGKEESGGFDLVKSLAGNLNYGDFYMDIPEELEEYAQRVLRLKEYANRQGSEVLFINTPPLYVEGYDAYTAGLPYQDTNSLMDSMLFYLQGYEIEYLDMRPVLKKSGLAPEKYRYRTDSHWTVEASFEGFRALADILQSKTGMSIDPENIYTNHDSYTGSVYPGRMVGSLGKRAGIPFSGREDFTLIVPEFPTSFTHDRDDGGEITRYEGDFLEALIDPDYLSDDNTYMAYLGGLAPFRRITNQDNADGLKILFISDSYSLPLAAFLACAASEVDMIYPRSQEVFGYSVDIDEYIEENAGSYDFIIIELEPGSFYDGGFSFFEE